MTKRELEIDFEDIASRIADDEPVDWSDVASAEVAGLRELEHLVQGFRRVQLVGSRHVDRPPPLFLFAHLEVQAKIGEGAHGAVFRAYDPTLDQQVALKVRSTQSGVLTHQFLAEARVLARVRHFNIVSVYGAAMHEGRAGIWSELVTGTSLAKLASDNEGISISTSEVSSLGRDLCQALAAIHRRGLVHGDIKLDNVMRDDSGRIVLMDFGTAREFRNTGSGSAISGTLLYLAPDVLRGAPVSPAADIYALGVLMFRLLSGTYPYAARVFEDLVAEQDSGRRRKLTDLRRDLPSNLVRAIECALAIDPAKRHDSALAFARALEPANSNSATKINRWIASAVFVIGILSGAAAIFTKPMATVWNTQASIYRESDSGRELLKEGSSVAARDSLALEFESSKTVYLYALNDDGSGSITVLFPIQGVAPPNPLSASVTHHLPEKMDWQINMGEAPYENFVVIASVDPLPRLEQMIVDWPRASAGAAVGKLRGTSGLVDAPLDKTIPSGPLYELLNSVEVNDARKNKTLRSWSFHFVRR